VRHHYGFTRIPANPVRTVGESVDIENYRIVDIVLRHLCTNLGKPDWAALDPGYVCCLRTRDKEINHKSVSAAKRQGNFTTETKGRKVWIEKIPSNLP